MTLKTNQKLKAQSNSNDINVAAEPVKVETHLDSKPKKDFTDYYNSDWFKVSAEDF